MFISDVLMAEASQSDVSGSIREDQWELFLKIYEVQMAEALARSDPSHENHHSAYQQALGELPKPLAKKYVTHQRGPTFE